MKKTKIRHHYFEDQVNTDQCKYSRYVCDSRAIPHEIDGLKPVQRRILWTMWNCVAKNNFTKTVKVAGLVMGYHPHGDKSIQDAIAAMTQEFPFANNFALIEGEGTFGDVLDPSAIASPRYTEVRLSPFAKDIGLFESLEDIEYIDNYDETAKEPVYFCAKVPLVLVNPIQGIATGFRTFIPSFRLRLIIDSLISYLKSQRVKKLSPYYRHYNGDIVYEKKNSKTMTVTTSFHCEVREKTFIITDAPQSWNREKVIQLLDKLCEDKDSPFTGYNDYSRENFNIEVHLKRGCRPTPRVLNTLLNNTHTETTAYNMITTDGRLQHLFPEEIIRRFTVFRKKHLIRRFKRLAAAEKETMEKHKELIRFIENGWNQKVLSVKSKADLEKKLKAANFHFFEWLSSIPIYRLTLEEVKKCQDTIAAAKKQHQYYNTLVKTDTKLVSFMIDELTEIKNKWDPK
jgi:DNA gyrase subunit A